MRQILVAVVAALAACAPAPPGSGSSSGGAGPAGTTTTGSSGNASSASGTSSGGGSSTGGLSTSGGLSGSGSGTGSPATSGGSTGQSSSGGGSTGQSGNGGGSSSGGTSGGTPGALDAGVSLAPGTLWWLMNAPEINDITAAGPAATALAQAYFDEPRAYITGGYAYPAAVQTMDFKAAVQPGTCPATLVRTLDPAACGNVGAAIGAVTLDIEGGKTWCSDPSEKAQPIAAYQAAYAQVQAFNAACRVDAGLSSLLLIATPGTDLILTYTADGGCAGASDGYHQYICLGLAGGVAAASDVYEVQAQSIQNSPSEFLWFVQAAAQQARTARGNPAYPVLAGITSGNGRLPSCDPGVLFGDVAETVGTVEGYWLNVFGGDCDAGITNGQVAADLLAMMADEG